MVQCPQSGQNPYDAPWSVFTKCGIFLYSRVYYDRDITEINLSDAKRDFGEDQPHADELL